MGSVHLSFSLINNRPLWHNSYNSIFNPNICDENFHMSKLGFTFEIFPKLGVSSANTQIMAIVKSKRRSTRYRQVNVKSTVFFQAGNVRMSSCQSKKHCRTSVYPGCGKITTDYRKTNITNYYWNVIYSLFTARLAAYHLLFLFQEYFFRFKLIITVHSC